MPARLVRQLSFHCTSHCIDGVIVNVPTINKTLMVHAGFML